MRICELSSPTFGRFPGYVGGYEQRSQFQIRVTALETNRPALSNFVSHVVFVMNGHYLYKRRIRT